MKLEEVTKAAEQGAVVLHTHMGITSRCRISGVITRYAKGAWTYSLELTDQWCRKIQSFSGLNGERVYLVCQKCGKVRDTMFLEGR